MSRLSFGDLTIDHLTAIADLDEHGVRKQPWEALATGELSPDELRIVDYVTEGLKHFQAHLVNEQTVFVRAIFPLLLLAETEDVGALAAVALFARIGDVELTGFADAALGRPVSGELRAPFLIVVEAKRGVEGRSPVPQLYGEMLAAASANAASGGGSSQRLYGCHTIADTWTFVQMSAASLDGPRPSASVVSSREFSEKSEAVTITKILKSIVAEHGRAGG